MDQPSDVLGVPHLRIARPSDDPDATARFYVDALGFEVQARFVDHDGFDGVVVGHAGWPWHLEFTREHGVAYGPASDDEHLLVFYVPDGGEWSAWVERVEHVGYARVRAANPYWDTLGATFADPDGYRVVIARRAWTNAESPRPRPGGPW